MNRIGTLLAIALLGVAACDGAPTEPQAFAATEDGPALAQSSGGLVFTSTQSQTEQTPQTASGAKGRIDFTGSLTTGDPCYSVTGSHTTSGNDVTLTVTATSTGNICAQVITYNNYQGSVKALAAGTYSFTVVHVVGTSSTTAFSGTVVVR